MIEPRDQALEAQFIANPQAGFPAIYDRYSGPLFGFIFRFVANADVAEEVLHDVFVQLLAGKFSATADSHLKAWLFAVAKNRALNFVARQKFEVSDGAAVERAADPQEMEGQLIELDLHLKLKKFRQSLPADLQQTWALRSEGMDYKQIAAELKIPVGTVKSRFSRLVDVLRKDFSDER